jgi:hypothetical protein
MSDDAQPAGTPAGTASPSTHKYNFSGSMIGAAAHFHKLDDQTLPDLLHMPMQGASLVSKIGGQSVSEVSNYAFEVDHPRKRKLVTVGHILSVVHGLTTGTRYQTVTESDIESITFVDKLRIDKLRFRMTASRDGVDGPTTLTTEGNLIQGIHIGAADIIVELDDSLLPALATGAHIQGRPQNGTQNGPAIQSKDGAYHFHLVKSLRIVNQDQEKSKIDTGPNWVRWDGFGTIFFGEVTVKSDDRRVTLVRLQMGSDAGGSGTVGDGHSNGSAGGN